MLLSTLYILITTLAIKNYVVAIKKIDCFEYLLIIETNLSLTEQDHTKGVQAQSQDKQQSR